MAFTPDNLVGSLLTAVLSGGTTAFSTVYGLFKDMRRKVEDLEKKVGSFESKSGIAYSVTQLESEIRDLKKGHQEETTDARRKRPSFLNLEEMIEAENAGPLLVQKLRMLEAKVREVEENNQRLELKLKRAITHDEFEQADRQRAKEISEVHSMVSEVKGLLQGVHMVLRGRV